MVLETGQFHQPEHLFLFVLGVVAAAVDAVGQHKPEQVAGVVVDIVNAGINFLILELLAALLLIL